MKKALPVAIAFLTLAGIGARAQSATTTTTSGVLGHRFAEIGVGAVDPTGSSDLGFGSDLAVNLPLRAGIDLGFGYSYSRMNGDLFDGLISERARQHTLYSTATFYTTYRGMKPFASAALGYEWSRSKLSFGGTTVADPRDDEAVWGLSAGVEIPLGAVTLTPTVSYQDNFKSNSGDLINTGGGTGSIFVYSPGRNGAGVFAYGAEASTWFTRSVGGFADVTYSDPTGGGTQAWTYKIGARLRF